MLDDSDLDLPSEQEAAPPPRRSGSRSFIVAAGILGGIMLLALVGLAVYALVIVPQRAAQQEPGLNAQQTGTAAALAAQATNTAAPTATRTATATRTPTPTRTPAPPTETGTPVTPLFTITAGGPTAEPAGATQTVEALLTQAALAQTQVATGTTSGTATATNTPGPTATASSLPQSGIGDGMGGPGVLIAAAAMLLLIIAAARRLRNAN